MYRNIFFYGSIALLAIIAFVFSLHDGFLVRAIINYSELVESGLFFLLFAATATALVMYPRRGRFGHMLFIGSFLLMNVFGYTVIHQVFYVLNNDIVPWVFSIVKIIGVACMLIATVDIYLELSDSLSTLKDKNSQLKESAFVDGLSGLFNRKYLEDLIQSQEFDSNKEKYALIVMDIDNFKSTNDTYGHSVGDLVIKACGEAIKKSLRTDSLGVRYGGEEFVIVAQANKKEAKAIASRVSKSFIALSKAVREMDGFKTLSIGISEFSNDTEFFEVFDKADKALYYAKNTGKNKTVVFSPSIVSH